MRGIKEGLIFENEELVYYKKGHPYHAGIVKLDGAFYYIDRNGRAVKGQHIVHREMTNGLVKRGTYTFGDDYKMIKRSYIAPQKKKREKTKFFAKLLPQKVRHQKRTRKKLRKKEKIVMWVAAGVSLCLAVSLILVHRGTVPQEVPQMPVEDTRLISLPELDEVLLSSEAAKQLYDGEITVEQAVATGEPYRPFVFEYLFKGASGTLWLGEKADLSDAMPYALPEMESKIYIDNLKTGTTYYYKVAVAGEEHFGSFDTIPTTRFVKIPGVVNTRDIGGYQTLDGKTVKQGLLIRGTEMDGLVVPSYYLPVDSIEAVQETFGFVYDLDLRESSLVTQEYRSRLGETVGHKFYTSPQYGQIFTPQWIASMHEIFTDLADPDKYPMYVHCSWGKDRTGTIIFLLQGLLNMPEEEMMCEFFRSGFSQPGHEKIQYMDAVFSGMQAYEGDTLQEQIENYMLTEVGITEEQIASIRRIFLEQ